MSEKLSAKEIENFQGDTSEKYPVMPLRNTVLFPQQVIPIYIGRERSLKLINDLDPNSKYIVVVAQEDGAIEDPKPEDLYSFGTMAQVLKVFDMPDNSKSAIVQGISRVKNRFATKGVRDQRANDLSLNILSVDFQKCASYCSGEHIFRETI